MARKSSRRDFLRGKAAARAMADAARQARADAGSEAASQKKGHLLQICRQAMACEFEVCLNAGQYPHGMDTALAALDMVDSLEDRLSIFRDENELSEVNRFAADGPVAVSPEVFQLLEMSAELYRQTDGAMDVSAAPLSNAWGFSRRQGRIPSDADLAAALEVVGMENVVLDVQDQTVSFLRPGVRLNLGAIGKGYALDRCGEVFAAAGIDNFIIHGGQSSVLARGASVADGPLNDSPLSDSPPSDDSGTDDGCGSRRVTGGWTVGVADPLKPGKRLAEIRLRDRALATSGSAKQFFRHKGRRYSHILDPRNGQPAQGVLSATVLAPTAAEADALATAVFVLGPDRSREFFESRPEIGVMLVLTDRGGRRDKIICFGLDEQDFRLS